MRKLTGKDVIKNLAQSIRKDVGRNSEGQEFVQVTHLPTGKGLRQTVHRGMNPYEGLGKLLVQLEAELRADGFDDYLEPDA